MPAAAAPLAVAFREVRHYRPDDCLHVEAIAVRGQLHAWTIPAHRHDGLHQFQWLQRGRAEATLDGRTVEIRAPAALMVAPGCVHGFVYAPDSQGQQISVPTSTLRHGLAGSPALIPALDETVVIELGRPGRDRDRHAGDDGPRALEALFSQVGAEFGRDAPGRVEALQSLALLVALWFVRHPQVMAGHAPRAGVRDTLVQRFRALALKHFREQRSVAFYADTLKVTPDHLSRACRAVAGLSALELLHERVLLEARRLLAFTEMPVAEVASAVGFDDAQYFSRFFAQRVGAAPSRYRLRAAEGRSEVPAEGA